MTTVFQRVGPYEIVREIGRGGMAAVFLAEDSRHARSVALKLVPMNGDREGREILDAERCGARLQAKLAEECGLVPRVFEEGDHPPYYFIAMEFVDGENLSDLISRGRLPPADVVRIASALCRFLDTAHRFKTTVDGHEFVSLVHGDLKPRNVRLSTTGDIKVLDFGIAKALSLSRKVTRNDFGSMPYLSPERLDSTEVDARADLWGLGVIVYELLCGTPPFHAEDTRRLEQQIRAGYPRRPLTAPCPVALQAIVARLLAPQPADRYPSAGALLDDLRLVDAGSSTLAESLGFPGRLDEAPTTRTRPAIADTEATRRTRPAPDPSLHAPGPAVGSAAATPAAARPVALPATRTARSRPLRAILMVVALLLVCNELLVGFSARRTAASAMTLDLDGLTDLWPRYDGLSHRSFLRVGVIGLERVLETRVQTLTDQVIGNYRSALPTVRERQWRTAQRNLQQVLVLAPRNASLKAALRYCEGHLHRIDGEAEKQRRRVSAANQHFTEAVSAFREAAELRRDWPDPFLGLARTFIYGLEDIDRGADAMQQAQKYGYPIGDRETAQLGDGYRARADSLWQTARRLTDLPQEAEYLQRAADAYRLALAQYERIPGYAGVAANLQRIHRSLDQLDERLQLQAVPKTDDRPQPPLWP